MREIKFRAWDGTEMYTPLIGRDGKPYRSDRDYEDANAAIYDELMQYTGIKDKNGKEIYEGDLFKGWNGVYVVAWLPFDAGLYLVQYDEWKDYLSGGESPVDVHTLNAKRYEFLSQVGAGEIIGNIWEHPHLLERSQS